MSREIHIGIVSRVNDPKKEGRIRVKCQTLAAAGVELPFWVKPIFAFTSKGDYGGAGFFFVPEPGSEVELEVNVSSPDDETAFETFISTPDVHYRAATYSNDTRIPEELAKNYPKRRGFVTPGGHALVIDDTKGSELVRLANAKGMSIELRDSKTIVTASEVHLGEENPPDAMALASLVADRLNKLQAAFDAHVHATAAPGPPTPPTPVPGVIPVGVLASTGSSVVKAK